MVDKINKQIVDTSAIQYKKAIQNSDSAIIPNKELQKLAKQTLAGLCNNCTDILEGYNKNRGIADVGTSMVMDSATLAGYTLPKETLDNLSNPVRNAKSFSICKQTGIASLESFRFGAFCGLLNETVVAPLVKYSGKQGKQVSQAVRKALSDNAELSGKDIMQTAINAQNLNLSGLFRMNAVELKNYAQILGAHAAGFGVEVVGFAGYEAGLNAIKDICDPQTGKLPENMTLANLTKYLADKIGEQFSNLGTIKGISQLLMMSKGGKAAQSAMMNKMIADSQKLNEVKFRKVNQNGNEVIEMTLPDGSKKLVSSTDQVVQTCQTLMQIEFVVNNLRPEEKFDPRPEEKLDPQKKKTKVEITRSINQKLSISVATDADLRAIQKIDMEAFEDRYVIDSDFEAYKADLLEQEIKTYAIKGESGDVVGYYQLEPVENGELYIYSIGVKKELRNSRTSYNALKQIQNAITEIARNQNLDKVVLDVDADKPELVKLYKKFGFEITGESRGTEQGQRYHDYRMEADVKKIFAKDTTNIEGVNNKVKRAQKSTPKSTNGARS